MVQARENYPALDGLRGICSICIMMMHMRAARDYSISGFFWDNVVGTWEIVVVLFLMLSSFGMCVGYYEKFKNKKIDIELFYKRRYSKLLPFFSLILLLDVIVSKFDYEHIIEALMKSTLLFGLLPNNTLETVGVSWTIGMIFAFYLLFPFFVFAMGNKKKGWLTLLIAVFIHYACFSYFYSDKFVDVSKFNYNTYFIGYAIIFVAGGLIYLYREEIKNYGSRHPKVLLMVCIVLTILYYISSDTAFGVDIRIYKRMVLFAAVISYGISIEKSILTSKTMRYLGSISMEIYLAHMVMYRFLEKIGLIGKIGDGFLSYMVVVSLVMIGLLVMITIYQYGAKLIKKYIT